MGVTTTILLPAGRPATTSSTHGGTANGLQAQAAGNEACHRFARAHAAFLCGANKVPDVEGATSEIERYLKRGAVRRSRANVVGERRQESQRSVGALSTRPGNARRAHRPLSERLPEHVWRSLRRLGTERVDAGRGLHPRFPHASSGQPRVRQRLQRPRRRRPEVPGRSDDRRHSPVGDNPKRGAEDVVRERAPGRSQQSRPRPAVREHRFREDLFFRLQVFPIRIPPLRDRREDIPPLVWAFIKEFGRQLGKVIEHVPRRSMEALRNYSWPGNVRELRNVIERSMILTDGPTLRVVLPDRSEIGPALEPALTLEEVERRHILDVLGQTGWRISGGTGAARILAVKPTTPRAMATKPFTRVPCLAAWVHRAPTLRSRWEANDVRPWTPIILFLAVVSGERDRRAAAFAALDIA